MKHSAYASIGKLAGYIIGTLNQRLLACILLTYQNNLPINCLYLMTFPLKPNISLSNLTVAEKIWLTVFLNAIVMPPNISEHGTLLKE